MAWTLEEKQRFYDKYGFWPNEEGRSPSDAAPDPTDYRTTQTVPGASEASFPMQPTRQPVTYDAFDVSQYGQQQADERRAMSSMSASEIGALIDREEELTSKVVRMAQAFGSNISYTPSKRAGRTTDPAKGVAASASMESFKKILFDNPPRTGAEAFALVKATNAGKAEVEFLNKLFPKLNLGKVVQMFRYENGQMESIWRHENAPLGEEQAAGFSFKFEAAKFEKTGESERYQSELAILAEAANITTQEGYDAFMGGLTENQKKALNTYPKVLAAVHKFVPDAVLKSAGKKALWSYEILDDKKTGKIKATYVDPALGEYVKKLETGDYFETIEELEANKDFNLTSFIADLLEDDKISDLTDPEAKMQVLQLAKKAGVTSPPATILEAYNKAVDAQGRENKKYTLDVNILNNEINKWKTWEDFYKYIEGKKLNPKAVTETAQKLQDRYGTTWRFEPVMVYNDEGEQKWITTGQGLQDAHDAGYFHENYNDAPNRPVPAVSDRYWISPQPNQPTVSVIQEDGSLVVVFTDEGKYNHIKATRDDIAKSVMDFESFTQRISMIMTKLKEGQRGTDFGAIRDLEKLQDETGVIRESDVLMIKASIGTYRDQLSKFWNKLLEKDDTYLTDDERDQIANHALTTLQVLQESMLKVLQRHKLAYAWDDTKTWDSKGQDKIDFFQVIPEAEYKKYLVKKRKEEYWDFQSDFRTPTVRPADETTTSPYSVLLPDG